MNTAVKHRKNVDWRMWADENGSHSVPSITVFVLMDIRDELQKLNHTLACPNFLDIPHKLDAINRKLTKPRKKKMP